MLASDDSVAILFLRNLIDLSLEAAPWLVLGLALGGLMKALIPTSFLQKHLSGNGIASISKAAILGAPLPLCSCGVIPAALGLRQAGASKPATASFLVSTPETGLDSISITYAMMGPFMAIVRPIAALFSALTSGLLVAIFDKNETQKERATHSQSGVDPSCCSSKADTLSHNTESLPSQEEKDSSCCSSNSNTKSTEETAWQRGIEGVHYAFTNLLDDIKLWLLIGLIFAAIVQTALPPDFLAQWGHGLPAMFIMILAGIPMYICATASTPVAAGLMMAGVSPGVALVLLLTGPATNISTLGVITQELGRRSMWLYLTGVIVVALISGLLVDYLVVLWDININMHLMENHAGLPEWVGVFAIILLLGFALPKIAPFRRFNIGSS